MSTVSLNNESNANIDTGATSNRYVFSLSSIYIWSGFATFEPFVFLKLPPKCYFAYIYNDDKLLTLNLRDESGDGEMDKYDL